MSATVQQIIDDARRYCDMENDASVTDATLAGWVLNSSQALADKLLDDDLEVGMLGAQTSITTVAGQAEYTLASGTYRIRGVDVRLDASSPWMNANPINFNQRNDFATINTAGIGWSSIGGGLYQSSYPNVFYRIQPSPSTSGSLTEQIVFSPTPQSTHQAIVHYVPQPFGGIVPNVTASIDCLNGFEEWIKLDVAMKLCNMHRETSFIPSLQNRLNREEARIFKAVPNRHLPAPTQMTRVAWRRVF